MQPLLDLCKKVEDGKEKHAATPQSKQDEARKKCALLAKRAACESTVLLKNDDILPLDGVDRIAVIGAFTQCPRYQGGGSSRVNPFQLDTPLDALQARLPKLAYAPGYDPAAGCSTTELAVEAAHTARDAAVTVLFLGQAEESESQGYDRMDFALPDGQVEMPKGRMRCEPERRRRTAMRSAGGNIVAHPGSEVAARFICRMRMQSRDNRRAHGTCKPIRKAR